MTDHRLQITDHLPPPPATRHSSAYYPPRARWYSRVLYRMSRGGRLFLSERTRFRRVVGGGRILAGLAVPGYSLLTGGRPLWGRCLIVAYAVALVVFVVALGYAASSIAFGVMISAHAISVVYLISGRSQMRWRFERRLLLAGLTLLVTWLAVYAPLIDWMERHWCMPLKVRGRVVVVSCSSGREAIRRGDFVLYRIQGSYVGDGHHPGGALWVRDGIGCGPVLGVPGDRVIFSTNGVFVNGLKRPRLDGMPWDGEIAVPEKHWFIWPDLDINLHGNFTEEDLLAALSRMAVVPQETYLGHPFEHWFGRRQMMP